MVKKLIEYYKSADYRNYVFTKDLGSIRRTLVLCVFLFGIFLIMDYAVYPELFRTFFSIRVFVVIPVLLFVIAISYFDIFEKVYQIALVIAMLISGISIIVMILLIGEVNYYYNGLYLIFLIAFFVLRLRPLYSMVCSIFLLLEYLYLSYHVAGFSFQSVVVHGIFYTVTIIIGVVGTMFFENYRRNQYYQERILVGENVVLEKQKFEHLNDIKRIHLATIFTLVKLVEDRDRFTGDHIYRVGDLSWRLAKEIPIKIYKKYNINKNDFVESIKLASILHDIGNISIPESILNKPGRLSNEEFDEVKLHTLKGYETMTSYTKEYDNNLFVQLGAEITRSHHEQWNGMGYPDNLHEEEIPLSARIVSIVDVYDALISERAYKKAYSVGRSLDIIEKDKGKKFDPIITDIFINMIKKLEAH